MSPDPDSMSRREWLTAGTGGALGGVLAGGQTAGGDQPRTAGLPDVYGELGVRKIINAAGTITTLGGSLMPPEVLAAWNAAAGSFVDLLELQDRVGARIAERLGVQAALVTTGAAGGILLGTAAAITVRDRSLVGRLPLPPELGFEVIRQKSHRQCYDHQVMACGVRLVDVETTEQLENAVSDRTVMMFAYNVAEDESTIERSQWLEVARRHSIPTLLDAAADTPPVATLWEFNRMGYDMVVFSGGKAMRGPQDAGLLLGRRDLVEAAKLNTSPRCGNIGRAMKVSKEDMVAMWAAVERFVNLDHDAEQREWERRIEVIQRILADIPSLSARRIVPPIANRVPHLLIDWNVQQLRMTPADLKQRLAEGDPPIMTARVHGTGEQGFLVSVFMLNPGEEQIVARRIKEVLQSGQG